MKLTLRAALLGGFVIGFGGIPASWAQQPPQLDAPPAATTPGTMTRDTAPAEARDRTDRSNLVDATALESGANSFTEGQARARFEDAGFIDVQDLRKDDAGFWRGRASRGEVSTEVALDFRGRIAAGPGVANLGTASRGSGTDRTGADARTGAADRSARPDGTPGNPPSTATGRAVDRMQGETPRPDGTPGNPPGTAAGRALGRATDGRTTGMDGSARPDGTQGNPPSTATGRAVDRMQGETPRPDGTPGNPPGTAAGRALDRATGSNTTGANPPTPGTTGGGTTR
jgi:hypothetical protein